MQDGNYSSIHIVGQDGIGVWASLNPTDVHDIGLPIQNTDDPAWMISKGGATVQEGKIYVTATNGTPQAVWVSCTYEGLNNSAGPPGVIYCKFKWSDPNGDNEQIGDAFWFLDPDDQSWSRASMPPVLAFPERPTFNVNHVNG